jgi:myosin heavy subunit
MLSQKNIKTWRKQIKTTPRKGTNSFNWDLNINKGDGFKHNAKIVILEEKDYESLEKEINQLKNTQTDPREIKNLQESSREMAAKLNKIIDEKDNEISDLTIQIQNKYYEIANLDEDIKILKESSKETTSTTKENNNLIRENTKLLQEIKTIKSKHQEKNKELNKQLQNQKDEIKKLSLKLESIEKNHEEKLNQLKESNDKLHQDIKEIGKEHSKTLKQTYDDFNKNFIEYVNLNNVQNQAFQDILKLNFIGLIMNKHKKIANENIKKIQNKPVIKYVPEE